MAIALYANNATSTLAGAINNTALLLNVAPGGGALFPSPIAGQYFTLTLVDAATGLLNEIVWVTSVSGDTFTILRGQEGTEAQNWSAGDIAAAFLTAGGCTGFVQTQQSQQQGGNSGDDTGTANSYVVALVPPLTAYVKGMPIRVRALNANTGPSTLNAGPGSLPITNPDGSAVGAGAVSAGGWFETVFDGAGHLQLTSASNEALSSQGISTTGAFQWRPTLEVLPGWIFANGNTIGNATSGASGRANADTFNLFAWHWNNFSNTQCAVTPSGRGASPAADFAANKTIVVINMQGTGMIGMDTMAGAASTLLTGVPVVFGNATTPGSVLGENLHALITAELAAHSHGISITSATQSAGHTHTGGGTTGNMNASNPHNHPITSPFFNISAASGVLTASVISGAQGFTAGQPTDATDISHGHAFAFTTSGESVTHTHAVVGTSASAGSGTAHNTVSRSMAGAISIKL